MVNQAKKEYPATRGLTWHRDQYYSFFIPIDWHKMEWSDSRQGVIYGPDMTDPFTVFAVDIKDLGTRVTPDEVDLVAEGFFESVEQLPECAVELRNQKASSYRVELEAKYTFREQGEIRKRWSRVFYHETYQITMTAQGETPEKYDYWLPWFFEAMKTCKVHRSKPSIQDIA